jgi:putative methionine-R-sulfoxide reductase with GAF domain
LQALLAFLALHELVRRRKILETRRTADDGTVPEPELEAGEPFTLDEVLQLVADRAVAITGADGLAIALAENNEIVLRAAAGTVRPDWGARIDRDSAFSGACFRTAQIVTCDDTETDARVNLEACRRLGARSMVAVPLCGRRRGIGLLQAFSAQPFGFDFSDVRNLSQLADVLLGALTPEDRDRFAESAQVAATKLEAASPAPETVPTAIVPAQVDVEAALVIVRKLLEEVTSTEDEVTPGPTEAILHEPTLEPEETCSESEPTVATEASAKPDEDLFTETAPVAATKLEGAPSEPEALPVAKPEMPAEEPDSVTRRPGMLVLLVCIVVASALAGGVWWKLKPSQLAEKMVRTEKMAPKPMDTAAKDAPALSAGTAANPANINPGATSNGSQAANSPAKPREMSKFPMVTGIQHWSSADSSTVVVNLEDQVQYKAHRLPNPDRIYFDLRDTQLASNLAWKSIEVGDALLNRIRVAQPVSGITRIVLETKAKVDFSVSLEPNPYRLVVEVRKVGASSKGTVNRLGNATEAEKSKLPILVPHMDFETARIGNGALVCSGVIGTVNIVLDAFALCNFGCTLGHEMRIGKGSVVNPGANISGSVKVGSGVLIGTGAQVLEYRTVGDHANSGSRSRRNLRCAPGITVVGIPAKPQSRNHQSHS